MFPPDPGLAFPSVFAQRALAAPDETALFEIVTQEGSARAVAHTFSDMDARIRSAVARLVAAGLTSGHRVALCVAGPPDFLSFLIATQVLGAVPVPLPSASDFRIHSAFRERVRCVIEDCEPRVIVTDSRFDMDATISNRHWPISVVDTDATDVRDLGQSMPRWSSFDRPFEDTAFIQYTSGSTGLPKGVVVTHRNLVANMRAIALGARLGPADRTVSWLPLYHDMGLVGGLLLGVYLGLGTFVMRTRSFVARPDSWLRAISQHRATFSCGPNFAYHIISHRLPDQAVAGMDLSSWRLAFNGAEPIDSSTIEAFTRRFRAAGVSATTMFPVYGLAESTLASCFSEPGSPPRVDYVDRECLSLHGQALRCARDVPLAVSVVSVGRALPDHQVRILDRDGIAELPERTVGEVVVKGPSVTPYYFRKDADYPPARTELRTGDLGYMADGELYLVDRIKDVLIICGRNIMPTDVERVVATVGGVRRGSVIAFARRGLDGTDALYLVVGVERGAVHDDLRPAVRKAVYDQLGLVAADVVLVRPSAVPKTSSGKVARAMCRELYERGAFEFVESA